MEGEDGGREALHQRGERRWGVGVVGGAATVTALSANRPADKSTQMHIFIHIQ